jgi:predicted permease
LFQTGVLAVLFIACANITNLLLARAASRRRELEVRLALGAPRARLLRFALAESLIISACGGAAGWLMAYAAVALVRMLPPYALPRLSAVQMDVAAAAAASATAIAAGLATGLWTLARSLRATRVASASLRGASTVSGYRPSRMLVVAQTAAGVVLLSGAALLLGSFVKLARVDRGFDPAQVLTFRVAQPPSMDAPAQHAFYDRLLGSFHALPGVRSAGAVERSLTGSSIAHGQVSAGGKTLSFAVAFQAITPGVFESLRIPLRGRDFTPSDRGRQARVAIVNETFARRAFPGANPVGRQIGFSSWPALEVVGVAADIRPGDLSREVYPAVFLPAETSRGLATPTFVVRADHPGRLVPSIRAVTARIDPAAVVFDATPLEDLLARQVTTPKFYGVTATIFASLGLVLAALGLFGMLSYSVNARTRELGIRIAIGASPWQVMNLILRETVLTVGVGIVAGLAAALYSARLLKALLFGLQPSEPAVLAGVAVLFLVVALVAAYLPARRAALVDPVVALRAE